MGMNQMRKDIRRDDLMQIAAAYIAAKNITLKEALRLAVEDISALVVDNSTTSGTLTGGGGSVEASLGAIFRSDSDTLKVEIKVND